MNLQAPISTIKAKEPTLAFIVKFVVIKFSNPKYLYGINTH